ncbi:hypothetical protein L218DRAFT_269385 [Marasmius fiardii PR-910]|nr:hypothetical protein L218DRAFT_269385 [Marasmius fiardii PR-910]
MVENSVVVHRYSYLDATPARTQASANQFLQEGRELLNRTLLSTKWSYPEATPKKCLGAPASNSYIYVPIPGTLQPVDKRDFSGSFGSSSVVPNMREWGSPVDDAEEFNMNNLPSFGSTDLDYLFDPRIAPSSDEENIKQQIAKAPPPEQFDQSPLFKVFPQPHLHVFGNAEMIAPCKIPAFSKADPIPIFPNTLPVKPLSNARRAWLVPVRGTLPWNHATPAVVLDPKISPQLPRSADPVVSLPIAWTHASLRAFWMFLLELKQRTGLGPITVSFTAAGYGSIRTLNSRVPRFEYMDSDDEELNASPSQGSPDTMTSSNWNLNALGSVDYIKVYHNAQLSMHLRSVIDCFGFEMKTGDGNEVMKVRVLESARLVLVDDLTRGVLVL